jgi:hypothetical protein
MGAAGSMWSRRVPAFRIPRLDVSAVVYPEYRTLHVSAPATIVIGVARKEVIDRHVATCFAVQTYLGALGGFAVRAAARRLVEQLTPPDLLFVVMTSSSESTGYFTRDRRQAVEMIDRFTGQRLPDRAMGAARFPGHDFEPERLDHYERLCETIRSVSVAFREIDVLTVTVPHVGLTPATAELQNEVGTVIWDGSGTPLEKASAVQFVVPLERMDSAVGDLTVTTSHGRERTTIGIAKRR